jgi:hypothetical protein
MSIIFLHSRARWAYIRHHQTCSHEGVLGLVLGRPKSCRFWSWPNLNVTESGTYHTHIPPGSSACQTQAPSSCSVCQTQLLGLAGAVKPTSLVWRTAKPTQWVFHVLFEGVEPQGFCYHTPCIARFATPMDSNIILEPKIINFIDFYIKS